MNNLWYNKNVQGYGAFFICQQRTAIHVKRSYPEPNWQSMNSSSLYGEEMGQIINLVGQRFGKLVVVREAGRNAGNKVMWLCQCDCGNVKAVDRGSLRSGHTRTCGCHLDRHKPLALQSEFAPSSDEYKQEYIREHGRKYRDAHREKINAYAKIHSQQRKEMFPQKVEMQHRKCVLGKDHGMTIDEYDSLFFKQNGMCASCGSKELSPNGYLCIDHDHVTGKIRGLLCSRCNLTLGMVHDEITVLESLIDYLILTNSAKIKEEKENEQISSGDCKL